MAYATQTSFEILCDFDPRAKIGFEQHGSVMAAQERPPNFKFFVISKRFGASWRDSDNGVEKLGQRKCEEFAASR